MNTAIHIQGSTEFKLLSWVDPTTWLFNSVRKPSPPPFLLLSISLFAEVIHDTHCLILKSVMLCEQEMMLASVILVPQDVYKVLARG